jgi:hypothetical protein
MQDEDSSEDEKKGAMKVMEKYQKIMLDYQELTEYRTSKLTAPIDKSTIKENFKSRYTSKSEDEAQAA